MEVVDSLPNIRYRIDNRWLFSDIADTLQPAVLDVTYATPDERLTQLHRIYDEYRRSPRNSCPTNVATARSPDHATLLSVRAPPNSYEHIPVVITNGTRLSASRFFFNLASRMKQIHGFDIEQAMRAVLNDACAFETLTDRETRKLMFQAMQNAWELGCQQRRPHHGRAGQGL